MSDGVLLTMNSNGKLEKYDDTYDLIIHCKSEEEYDKAVKLLTGRRWIPISERLPKNDEYILVSFDNFTLPDIGRYEVDKDGNGAFYPGDEDESYVSYGCLVVNAWMPLPEPYRVSAENAQPEETPLTEQQQTNAERIRSMTDEELAAYILNFKNTYGEEYEGESSFLDWLKAESEG